MAKKKISVRRWLRDVTRPIRHMRIEQKLLMLAALALAVFFAVLLVQNHRDEVDAQNREVLYNKEVLVLEQRRAEIERKIEETKDAYAKKLQDYAAVTILVETLDNEMAWELCEEMRLYGFSGVFVLTDTRFPDMEDCLTAAEFGEYLDDGWTWSLYWGGRGDFSSWLDERIEAASQLRIGLPEAVFFASDGDLEANQKTVREAEIPYAICLENETAAVWDSVSDQVWSVDYRGWNSVGISLTMEEKTKTGGALLLAVGRAKSSERYRAETFQRMLERVYQWRVTGGLDVVSLDSSFESRRAKSAEQAALEEERDALLLALQEEFDAAGREMAELYERYFPS